MVGTPGGSYIAALHTLINGGFPTAVQVLGVVGFVAVEFALVIIPFAFLAARPEATQRTIQRFKDSITSQARQLLAAAALLAGGYMVVSGALRVLG